jgi:hypothetical protein
MLPLGPIMDVIGGGRASHRNVSVLMKQLETRTMAYGRDARHLYADSKLGRTNWEGTQGKWRLR